MIQKETRGEYKQLGVGPPRLERSEWALLMENNPGPSDHPKLFNGGSTVYLMSGPSHFSIETHRPHMHFGIFLSEYSD